MATTIPLELAVEGDAISIEALSAAVNFCNDQADALDAELSAAIKSGVGTGELGELRDMRNAYRAKEVMKHGFHYHGVGVAQPIRNDGVRTPTLTLHKSNRFNESTRSSVKA